MNFLCERKPHRISCYLAHSCGRKFIFGHSKVSPRGFLPFSDEFCSLLLTVDVTFMNEYAYEIFMNQNFHWIWQMAAKTITACKPGCFLVAKNMFLTLKSINFHGKCYKIITQNHLPRTQFLEEWTCYVNDEQKISADEFGVAERYKVCSPQNRS